MSQPSGRGHCAVDPRWLGNRASPWRGNGRSRPTWRTSCTRRDWSTGTPKGVMISHRNYADVCELGGSRCGSSASKTKRLQPPCAPALRPARSSTSSPSHLPDGRVAHRRCSFGRSSHLPGIDREVAGSRTGLGHGTPCPRSSPLLACYGSLQQLGTLSGLRTVIFAEALPPQAPRPADSRSCRNPRYLNSRYGPTGDQRGHGVRSTRGLGWKRATGPHRQGLRQHRGVRGHQRRPPGVPAWRGG